LAGAAGSAGGVLTATTRFRGSIALAVKLLPRAAVFQLLDGAPVSAFGALWRRQLAIVRVRTLITFMAYWVVRCPAAGCWPSGWAPVRWACGGPGRGLGFRAVLLGWRFHHKTPSVSDPQKKNGL